ncbi:response regulator [Inmirania thermothiophila]|uniref:Two-component system chemotaxis response regulator CheY n=1 Tax=Inmirania thermothiophila TaxID=1750597 RepID=A0A3N1YC37_9GAMM|nr:response regulator [Inmirania thermothiophila]ROR34947.1 two-component system chemotaxis response regulator CheY [Inmirania thermothiophila]
MPEPAEARILIADAQGAMRRILAGLLGELGCARVGEAESAEEALAALQAEPFDLLIVDYHLPETGGPELVQALRRDPALAGIRILMVSPEASREQVLKAAEAGVDGYLVKPFTAALLQERIRRLLG